LLREALAHRKLESSLELVDSSPKSGIGPSRQKEFSGLSVLLENRNM
jgi:hypothetical protein